MLKLQLYLSSFLHLVQTISLQHSHIFVQKEVHRTYLEAQISVHISFKVRGQVFVKFHYITNCTITSLYYSDGISATTNPTILLAAYRVLRLVLVLTIRYEELQIYKNVNEFDLRLRFRSYHKERPKDRKKTDTNTNSVVSLRNCSINKRV